MATTDASSEGITRLNVGGDAIDLSIESGPFDLTAKLPKGAVLPLAEEATKIRVQESTHGSSDSADRIMPPPVVEAPAEEECEKIHLPAGTQFLSYRLDKVLGQGGFGITYQGTDLQLHRRVAIKEFLPAQLAFRSQRDQTVQPRTHQDRTPFEKFRTSFMAEARMLARFAHPSLVRVLTFFEANNTGYIVMEFEEGESLAALLRCHKTLAEERLLPIVHPLLDGLEQLHKVGVIHRDIKPANIYLREKDGSPVLLDFGAARTFVAEGMDPQTVTALFTPGYAPVEQYASDASRQGPWTDIYALGAVLYHGITGHKPVAAFERSNAVMVGRPDPLKPLAGRAEDGIYSARFLRAIDQSLNLFPEQRPKSIAEWREMLDGTGALPLPPVIHEDKGSMAVQEEKPVAVAPPKTAPLGRGWKVTAVAALLVGLGAYGYHYFPPEPTLALLPKLGQVAQPLPSTVPAQKIVVPAEVTGPLSVLAPGMVAFATPAPPPHPTAASGNGKEAKTDSRITAVSSSPDALPRIGSDFVLTTSRGKNDGLFYNGEKIQLRVRSQREGLLYLFDVDDQNNIVLLQPLPGVPPQRLRPGEEIALPDGTTSFHLQAQPPFGRDLIWAILSPKPLHLPPSSDPVWHQPTELKQLVRSQAAQGGTVFEDEASLVTRP